MLTGFPAEHGASAWSPYGSRMATVISCVSIWLLVMFLKVKEKEMGALANHPPSADAVSGFVIVRGGDDFNENCWFGPSWPWCQSPPLLGRLRQSAQNEYVPTDPKGRDV